MEIYIASSWKNQHAVEMLTALLRKRGHEVMSWVENNYDEDHAPDSGFDFETWVQTEAAERSFQYDTTHAIRSNLVIYVGPSGTDAWAEVGAAWASGVRIFGLWAKGEASGLMRKMVDRWHSRVPTLLDSVDEINDAIGRCCPNGGLHGS
jgi:hypothetical protein